MVSQKTVVAEGQQVGIEMNAKMGDLELLELLQEYFEAKDAGEYLFLENLIETDEYTKAAFRLKEAEQRLRQVCKEQL